MYTESMKKTVVATRIGFPNSKVSDFIKEVMEESEVSISHIGVNNYDNLMKVHLDVNGDNIVQFDIWRNDDTTISSLRLFTEIKKKPVAVLGLSPTVNVMYVGDDNSFSMSIISAGVTLSFKLSQELSSSLLYKWFPDVTQV